MQQIKIFKGLETELPLLEQKINAWLAQPGLRIVQVFGNMAPQTLPSDIKVTSSLGQVQHVASDVFMVVVYEKT